MKWTGLVWRKLIDRLIILRAQNVEFIDYFTSQVCGGEEAFSEVMNDHSRSLTTFAMPNLPDSFSIRESRTCRFLELLYCKFIANSLNQRKIPDALQTSTTFPEPLESPAHLCY
jgi:hypothetical protein